MAHCGHALIGDPVYGGRRKLSAKAIGAPGVAAVAEFSRQALHAATLGFEHPVTGENLSFAAPVPADFNNLMRALED
jgi:23S rRNA pseudouridine1911/1915/1917 synthase